MFHKALRLNYRDGTELEVLFADGIVRRYDMANLFGKYPQLKALEDRKLFTSGKLYTYSIIWTDELDVETETIYEDGYTAECVKLPPRQAADAVCEARAEAGISQLELAAMVGINQANLSKFERGLLNPTVSTLDRIAKALNRKLVIKIVDDETLDVRT